MSGIAGIFRRDGAPVDRSLLERMARSMDYRAVGGRALWAEGPVGLLQLGSTVAGPPPEGEPLVVERSDRFVLVFAGHIDNPEELEEALPEAGRGVADTDAALALRAVEAWGDAAADRIVGPFALVAWDRQRRRLWCARDFVGMRPLFYHASDRLFLFASDLHALFLDPSVPREPDEGIVAEYLAVAPTSREETLFEGIKRVLPGHWLAFEKDTARGARYWFPPTRLLKLDSDVEAAERLRDALTRATKACVRGHSRVAAQLSGGLDSSSIVVTARQLLGPDSVEAASLIFPGMKDCDERPYIDAVQALTGGPAITVPFRPAGLEPLLRETERFLDLPSSPNGTMHDPLLEELRSRGHRVLLDGQGGDMWLTGSRYQIADCVRGLDLRRLWRLLLDPPGTARSRLGRLARYGGIALLPWPVRRRLPERLLPEEERDPPVAAWIEPAFAARTGLRDRLAYRPDPLRLCTHSLRDLVRGGFNAWLDRSNEMIERTGAVFGLDTRSPLNDRRLVDVALALPDRLRWGGGPTKLVLRRAMGEGLPARVRERRDKAEFSAVFAEEYGRPGFDGLFRHPQLERQCWTRRGAAGSHLEAMRRGRRGLRGHSMWGAYVLVALEVWSSESVRR